jgi:hypothetical protein
METTACEGAVRYVLDTMSERRRYVHPFLETVWSWHRADPRILIVQTSKIIPEDHLD